MLSAIDVIKKSRIIDSRATERLSQIIQAEMVGALGGAPAAEPKAPLPMPVPVPPPTIASTPRPCTKPAGEWKKVDLRTLRSKGRVFAVNTKIKPESGEKLIQLVKESGKSLAEVIEDLISITPG